MNQAPSPDNNVADIGTALGLGAPRRTGPRVKWLVLGIVAVLAAALAWRWLAGGGNSGQPRFETAAVERGDLTVTVSATGTLQPTNQVDVGSELSGTVLSVYADDNSEVKKGQVLARLDVSKLNDQIVNARAALKAAEASVLQAEATSKEASANLARQQEVFKLSGGKVPSKAEMETAEASLARAEANLAAARASVTQARATLSTNETNLAKASIRSPIDGVVLARKVEAGQTVAASLNAPVLFTLAEDLARMELRVNVDEADVGRVKEGQAATFNVDAYARRKYPAVIQRVSYGSQTTDGVVSYTTVLKVDNEDLSLRPGMTATAEILTDRRENVLLVPNAALRFTPPRNGGRRDESIVSSLMPRPPRPQTEKTARPVPGKEATRQVWVLQNNQPVAVEVKTGATNGRMTEILEGGIEAGTQVITDTVATAAR